MINLKNQLKSTQLEYNIASFLDYLNLEIGINAIDSISHFNYEYIEKYIKTVGTLKIANAYGPWAYCKIAAQKLKAYKVNLIEAQRIDNHGQKKDYVDVQMATDIMDVFHTYPEINCYLIISGDIDFVPVIKRIKQKSSKKVIIIAEKSSVSSRLRYEVDKVLIYQELEKIFRL